MDASAKIAHRPADSARGAAPCGPGTSAVSAPRPRGRSAPCSGAFGPADRGASWCQRQDGGQGDSLVPCWSSRLSGVGCLISPREEAGCWPRLGGLPRVRDRPSLRSCDPARALGWRIRSAAASTARDLQRTNSRRRPAADGRGQRRRRTGSRVPASRPPAHGPLARTWSASLSTISSIVMVRRTSAPLLCRRRASHGPWCPSGLTRQTELSGPPPLDGVQAPSAGPGACSRQNTRNAHIFRFRLHTPYMRRRVEYSTSAVPDPGPSPRPWAMAGPRPLILAATRWCRRRPVCHGRRSAGSLRGIVVVRLPPDDRRAHSASRPRFPPDDRGGHGTALRRPDPSCRLLPAAARWLE